MSNSNFNYLKPTIQAPTTTTTSRQVISSNNKKNNKVNAQKLRNSIDRAKIIENKNPEFNDFKKLLKQTLENDYERPFMENIDYIKKVRGKEEYIEALKKINQEIIRQKDNTEKALIGIKKYLDYMQPKNNTNNKPKFYFPGLEEESKLDPIILPDLLGFTKSPVQAELYSNILVEWAKSCLGLSISLKDSLFKVEEYVKNSPYDYNIDSIGLEREMHENKDFKPFAKVKLYYRLLKMLDSGKFNLEELLPTKKREENIRFKGEIIKPIFGKEQGQGKHKKGKHQKGKQHQKQQKKRFDKRKFQKRPGGGENRSIEDMISFILYKELIAKKDKTTDYNLINANFQRNFREECRNLFFKYLVKNNDSSEINNIRNFLTNKSCIDNYNDKSKFLLYCLSKNPPPSPHSSTHPSTSTHAPLPTSTPALTSAPAPASTTTPGGSGIKNKIKKGGDSIYKITYDKIVELMPKSIFNNYNEKELFGKGKIKIVDFLTNQEVTVQLRKNFNYQENISQNLNQDDYAYLGGFYMLAMGYDTLYSTYDMNRIMKDEYGLEMYRDSVHIVKSIDIYLMVCLDLLNILNDKLTKLLGSEVISSVELSEKSKEEKNKLLKEIDMKILYLKKELTKNISNSLKEEILSKISRIRSLGGLLIRE